MLTWYLLYTKPKHEDDVARRISDNGFECLNPKLKERKNTRSGPKDAISPLFPCYLFVKFDIFRSYRFFKYTRGVRRIVGAENVPTAVNEDIISSIRLRTNGGFVEVLPAHFTPGEAVVVKGGVFDGLDAVFEREIKGQERVCILLKSVNARAVIDAALLAKTS